MADDFYSAFMLRGNIGATTDIKAVTAPGMYAVASGNASAPDSVAGVLVVLPPTTSPKLKFIKENDWNTYSLVDGKWQGLGSAAGHDEGDFLLTSGGTMTGPIAFSGGDAKNSYALNRQTVWSLLDCCNALPLGNNVWNKVGTVDTTKDKYGRVSFTLVGAMSHDVGMAVQAGYANIDIIGTDGTNPPGLTLTFFKPDDAKGTVIATAVLSASPTQAKCFDLWIKTQSAVAGILSYGRLTTPGYFTMYKSFETTSTDPTPATPTGVVYMVSANSNGDVNIKRNLSVAGTTTLRNTTVKDSMIIAGSGKAANGEVRTPGELFYPYGTANMRAELYAVDLVNDHFEYRIVIVKDGVGTQYFSFREDGGFVLPGYVTASGNVTAWDIKANGGVYDGGERVYSKKNPPFSSSLNQNGWHKTADGLIEQWGYVGSSNGTFNFPIPFPNACINFMASNANIQGQVVDNAYGYPNNNATFTVATKNSGQNNSVSNYPVYWTAKGH